MAFNNAGKLYMLYFISYSYVYESK